MEDRTAGSLTFGFEGQNVRIVTIEGEPWFVARDVAVTLGYAEPTNAVRQHAKGGAVHTPLQTAGGVQQTRILSEPDVLRLVMNSRLPSAERFERWVFEEVLPSIRRTGSYWVAEKSPMEIIADQHKAVAYLLEANEQQAVAITALTPRAEAWDDLASAAGDYSVGDAAKILARAGIATGRQRLFYQLADVGWIKRRGEAWFVMQTAVDSGYLTEKPQSHHHPRTGELVLDTPQVRVTIRGIERLRVRLGILDSTAPILTAVNA